VDFVKEYDRFYTNNPDIWASESHDRMVFDLIKSYGSPARLLDVGCGNGHTIKYFSRYWNETEYHGIDLSRVAVDLAKAKTPAATFTACDLLQYESEPYKIITLIGSLEHFPAPQAGLKKAKELLANNGMIYVEVPNCIEYQTSKGEEGFIRVEQGSCQVEWHLRRPSWEALIADSGLHIRQSITGQNKTCEFIWLLEH